MLKLTIIILLLCATFLLTHAIEKPQIVRELKPSLPSSFTFAKGTDLITVAKNKTHIFVDSTEENFTPCIIGIDLSEQVINVEAGLEATALSEGIVVWAEQEQSRYIASEKQYIKSYTFLLVDPQRCTMKSLPDVELERSDHGIRDEKLPIVLAYNNSFDVFYNSFNACSPCRYSNDGVRIHLDHKYEVMKDSDYCNFHIEKFHSNEIQNGYLQTCHFPNDTSTIALLDQHFRVVKQVTDYSPKYIAVSPGSQPIITSCYETIVDIPAAPGRRLEEVHCEHYDHQLKQTFSIKFPVGSEHHRTWIVTYMTVAVDDVTGDSFLVKTEKWSKEWSKTTEFYRIDSTGKVVQELDFGKLQGTKDRYSEMFDGFEDFSLRSFIVGRQYCLVAVGLTDKDHQEHIRCINI